MKKQFPRDRKINNRTTEQEVTVKLRRHARRQRWIRVTSVLASIMVFVTTYAMILPTITATRVDLPDDFPVTEEAEPVSFTVNQPRLGDIVAIQDAYFEALAAAPLAEATAVETEVAADAVALVEAGAVKEAHDAVAEASAVEAAPTEETEAAVTAIMETTLADTIVMADAAQHYGLVVRADDVDAADADKADEATLTVAVLDQDGQPQYIEIQAEDENLTVLREAAQVNQEELPALETEVQAILDTIALEDHLDEDQAVILRTQAVHTLAILTGEIADEESEAADEAAAEAGDEDASPVDEEADATEGDADQTAVDSDETEAADGEAADGTDGANKTDAEASADTDGDADNADADVNSVVDDNKDIANTKDTETNLATDTAKADEVNNSQDAADPQSGAPSAEDADQQAAEALTMKLAKRVDGITVTAEFGRDVFPAGVQMLVRPVEGEVYEEVVADATGKEGQTLLPLDIEFVVGGQAVEPDGTVQITFEADFLTEEAQPEVVHVTDDGSAEAIASNLEGGQLTLTTDSFSVYVIAYTVDFSYSVNGEMYYFSLPGGEKIALSQLIEVLGIIRGTQFESISDFLKAVESVEFSDDSLVKVSKSGLFGLGNDWIIQSLKAFNSEETLTITMDNGAVIVVKVTDAQAGYIDLESEGTVTASLNTESSSTVSYNKDSQRYTADVKLEFTIPSDRVQSGKKFDLTLGEDVVIPRDLNREFEAYDSISGSVSFKYKYVYDDTDKRYHMLVEYQDDYLQEIKDSGRTIGKNTVNINIEINKDVAHEGNNLKVKLTDKAELTIPDSQIKYPDNATDKSDISVQKSYGSYDKASNQLKYTVTVSTNAGTDGKSINLEDIMSVNGDSTVEVTSISVSSITKRVRQDNWEWTETTVDPTAYVSADASGKKFTVNSLPDLPANSQYVIEYYYQLDDSIKNSSDFSAEGINSVKATSDTIHDSSENGWNITKSGIGVGKNGSYNSADGMITWTISVTNNTNDAVPVVDDAFTDASFTDLSITDKDGNTVNITPSGNTLTLPAGENSYTITYKTKAVSSDPTSSSDIKNTVTAGGKTAEGTVNVPSEAGVGKQLMAVFGSGDVKEVTWRVSIYVPKAGFKAGTVFTEEMSFLQDDPWAQMHDKSYFTEAQYNSFIDQVKNVFGDNIEVDYTPASRTNPGDGSGDVVTAAKIVITLKEDWNGVGKDSTNYAGGTVVIDYKTTADISEIGNNPNTLTNTFKLNDTPASVMYSFADKVTKKSAERNPSDVTTTTVTKDNNKLHWYIEVNLDQDTDKITVEDLLPEGVKGVTEIAMGPGENKGSQMTSLYSEDGGITWIPATEWGHGVAPWMYTSMTAITPAASVSGRNVTITATLNNGEERPVYFKKGSKFYFYIEVEVDDSNFPAHGSSSSAVDYKNTVNISLDDTPYGSDDQTQKVTFETSAISKGGNANNWNGRNGAHELSYTVDINPTGGHLCVDEKGNPVNDIPITVEDKITYKKNVDGHDVIVSLKDGSKLQKYVDGAWVDIPITDGWGYTLYEGDTDAEGYKTKTINLYGIPDDTKLRFVYAYTVEVTGLEKGQSINLGDIKNTATIKANFEESSETIINKQWDKVVSDASTTSSGSLTLVKVQKDNYAVLLADTYYVLEQYDGNGSWEIIDPIGDSYVATIPGTSQKGLKPGKNAALSISADPLELDKDGNYQKDVLYRVREYRAQEGYKLDESNPPTGYFFFSDDADKSAVDFYVPADQLETVTAAAKVKYPSETVEKALRQYIINDLNHPEFSVARHADNLLVEADTVYLENEKISNTITADKYWSGINSWPNDTEVTLKLVKTDGSDVAEPEYYKTEAAATQGITWSAEKTLDKDHTSAMWEYLDLVNGNYSDYKVIETSIKVGGTELTKEELTDGTIVWKNNEGEIEYRTYGGKLTGTKAVITNAIADDTDMPVRKIWASTDPNGENTTVTFTLMSRERLIAENDRELSESEIIPWDEVGEYKVVEPAQTKTVDKDNWSTTFEDLDMYRYDSSTGKLYEVQYSVSEKVMLNGEDVTASYAAKIEKDTDNANVNAIKVTNSQNAGDLEVFKTWQQRNGSTEAPAGTTSVVINLQRYILDSSNNKHYDERFNRTHRDIELTATGSVSNGAGGTLPWSYLFENLQITGTVDGISGDYHYEVIEDTVTGYVTGYTGNNVVLDAKTAGGTAKEVTIKNVEHYEEEKSDSIEVKVKKTWDDSVSAELLKNATATFRLYRYVLSETSYVDPTAETTTVTLKNGSETETTTLPVGSEVYLTATFEGNTQNPYAVFSVSGLSEDIAIHGETSYVSNMVTSERTVTVSQDMVVEVTSSNGLKTAEGESEAGQKSLGIGVRNATLVMTPAAPDTEFNDSANDQQWTVTITGNGEAAWDKVQAFEEFVSDGETRRYVYGYYAVETSANANNGRTYIPVYEGAGSEQNRIYNVGATIPIKNEPGDSLKISKRWYRLVEDNMPPVVVQLSYQERQNDGWRDVTGNTIAVHEQNGNDSNSSSSVVKENAAFRIITDKGISLNVEKYKMQDGTEKYGILLSADTGWDVNLVDLPANMKDYKITELGYLDDGVIKTFPTGDQGFDNRHYYYNKDDKEPAQTDHAGIFNYVTDKNNIGSYDSSSGNKTGTMFVYNIPTYIGYQPELKKYWYGFDGEKGMQNLASNYNPDGLGYKVWTQQRATWVYDGDGHKAGDLVHDWEDYLDELTIYMNSHEGGSEYETINDHNGGDAWLTTFHEYNFSKFGYELNETNGKYELVQYDYQFRETGTVVGADGRTWSKYSQGYLGGHRYNMMNFETGPLEIKKVWDLTDEANKATKVYFTVKSDDNARMADVAKRIYEDKDYSYYGLTSANVAYVKELDEYCIVMSASDNWDLIIKSLDLLNIDVDETGKVTIGGEVTYKVEEVAVEKGGEIIAITDNTFPYTASYYSSVRGDQEQLRGNTAENSASNRLVADGLQLDSESTWNGTTKVKDNQPTYVKVVNSDKPVTSYTITKAWPNGEMPTDSTKVVMNLQQRLQAIDQAGNPIFKTDGTPEWDGGWQAAEGTDHTSVTLPLEGLAGRRAWTYVWKGLPTYKEISGSGTADAKYQPIYYRVIETSAPGWAVPKLKTFENGTEIAGSEGSNESYIGQTAFVVDGTDKKALEQTLTNEEGKLDLTIGKEWQRNGTALDEWPDGYVVNYKVVRHTYLTTSTTDSETGAVTYTRGWELEDERMDPYMEGGAELKGALTKNNQTVEVKGLPKGGFYHTGSNPPAELEADMIYSVEYEYEIVETAMLINGQYYETKATATPVLDENDKSKGTATIVNNLTSIKVVKAWDDGFDHSSDSVQVQLYSSAQRPEGAVPPEYVDLSVVADNWIFEGTDNERTTAPTDSDASITFAITANDDIEPTVTDTLDASNGWKWMSNTELPKYDDNDQAIAYTVTVTDNDGNVVKKAELSSGGAVTDGGTVHITGEVEKPVLIEKMRVNVSAEWWYYIDSDYSWKGATAPGNGSITLTITGSDGNEYPVTLNAGTNWSSSVEVNKTDDKGDAVSFSYNWSTDGTYVLNTVNYKYENGGASIKYQAQVPAPSSGESDPDGTVKYNYNGEQSKTFSPGETIVITINVSNGWGDVDAKFTVDGQEETKRIYTNTGDGTGWGEHSVEYTIPDSGVVKIEFTNTWVFNSVTVESKTAGARGARFAKAPTKAPAATSNKTVTNLIVSTADDAKDQTPSDRTAVGTEVTLTSDLTPAWTYEWTDLPMVDGNGDPIYYYVRELSANVDGRTKDVYVSYSYENRNPEDARDGIKQVTITNRTTREEQTSIDLNVKKLDSSTKALIGGAVFTIEKQNGSDWESFGVGEFTAANGTYKITDLTEGTYRITEKTAPKKYVAITDPAIFTVTKDGSEYKVEITQGDTAFSVKTELNEVYLEVENTKKTTDFEFTKIWRLNGHDLDWPTEMSITVTLNAFVDSDKPGVKAITDQTFTLSPDSHEGWTVEQTGKETKFKITGLDATDVDGNDLTYYVVEQKVNGYDDPKYAFKQSMGITYKPDTDKTKGMATDKQYVINIQEGGYVLPSTGGSGTAPYAAAGALLVGAAGTAGVIERKRRRRRARAH